MTIEELEKLIEEYTKDVEVYVKASSWGGLKRDAEQVAGLTKRRLIESIKKYALECVQSGLSVGLKKR